MAYHFTCYTFLSLSYSYIFAPSPHPGLEEQMWTRHLFWHSWDWVIDQENMLICNEDHGNFSWKMSPDHIVWRIQAVLKISLVTCTLYLKLCREPMLLIPSEGNHMEPCCVILSSEKCHTCSPSCIPGTILALCCNNSCYLHSKWGKKWLSVISILGVGKWGHSIKLIETRYFSSKWQRWDTNPVGLNPEFRFFHYL